MALGIFLDMETNGLNPHRHRSLELALRVLDLPDGREVARYDQIVSQPRTVWECSDPTSLQVNGFSWEMVRQGIPEDQVAREVIQLFEEIGIDRSTAVYFCQNPSFDRAFFSQIISPDHQEERHWPYHWLDLASIYWAWRGGGDLALSKDSIAEHLGLPREARPHRAMNGVDHLILCYSNIMPKMSQ